MFQNKFYYLNICPNELLRMQRPRILQLTRALLYQEKQAAKLVKS